MFMNQEHPLFVLKRVRTQAVFLTAACVCVHILIRWFCPCYNKVPWNMFLTHYLTFGNTVQKNNSFTRRRSISESRLRILYSSLLRKKRLVMKSYNVKEQFTTNTSKRVAPFHLSLNPNHFAFHSVAPCGLGFLYSTLSQVQFQLKRNRKFLSHQDYLDCLRKRWCHSSAEIHAAA